jgi:pantoate--beta-alanine ligase
MSSRNSYLSKAARKEALNIFRSLKRAEEIVKEGIRDAEVVKGAVRSILREGEDTRIDYIQIARYEDLSKIDELEGKIIVAVAVFVGDTRLIDNIVMNVK